MLIKFFIRSMSECSIDFVLKRSPKAVDTSRACFLSSQQKSFSKYLLLLIVDTNRRVFVAQFQLSQAHAVGQVFIREQPFFEIQLVAPGQFASRKLRIVSSEDFVVLLSIMEA